MGFVRRKCGVQIIACAISISPVPFLLLSSISGFSAKNAFVSSIRVTLLSFPATPFCHGMKVRSYLPFFASSYLNSIHDYFRLRICKLMYSPASLTSLTTSEDRSSPHCCQISIAFLSFDVHAENQWERTGVISFLPDATTTVLSCQQCRPASFLAVCFSSSGTSDGVILSLNFSTSQCTYSAGCFSPLQIDEHGTIGHNARLLSCLHR